MDKNNLIGLVLITLIVTAWLIYSSWDSSDKPPEMQKKKTDSVQVEEEPEEEIIEEEATEPIVNDSLRRIEDFGKTFAPFSKGTRETVTIETDLVEAVLSTKGASLIRWKLKKYDKWDKVPTQLIRDHKGQLYLTFVTFENKKIDSRNLYFELDSEKEKYRISKDQKLTIKATLELEEGKYIEKTYTFYGNKYHVDTDVKLVNLGSVIPSRGYNYAWSGGLAYQEKNSVDESQEAVSMASMNGEVEELDAEEGEGNRTSLTGIIDYAAVKIKYFGAAIIPQPYREFDGTVDLEGQIKYIRKKDSRYDATLEVYDMALRVPYKGGVKKDKFKVYIGPLDYDIVERYGLEKMIYFGFEFGIRQIGEYFLRPLFQFIHKFVPNYGVVLIIFSIFIKLLLYPLSIQQMRSAQKMKLLGPEMEKVREKYKDDNTKQQQAIMKLYSEYGINPAGGCLPLLFQMPILFALWQFLRSAIDLRQEPFILWIDNLATPDVLVMLPFKFIIIDSISGLALLMGITMFIQQKMTITDPRQKAMVYMMPVMFTLLFSSFPSGLNLYYFMFNLIGIGMQLYMNNFSSKKLTLADLKKAPKKEGWFQKKMREAQEVAASQGRSVPGKYDDMDKKKQQPKKPQLPKKKTSPTQGKKKK